MFNSDLDFIKKIVEIVDLTLTKISSKDNNSLETSKGEPSNLVDVNKMLNLSRTLDTRDLEISYRQGFMVGSAWKDGIISSMQSRIYNWGVEPRPLFSRRFAAFVPAPTCYSRPLELNVLPDYRPTFSYYNIIYQHPPWPHATRYSNEQRFQPIMDHAVGSSATFATSEGITSSISSDFGIDPTSMNDDIVLTLAFAAEAEDRTSFTSLDFDECSTTTSMHDEIVSGSNNTVTENMTRFSSSDLDQYPTMDPTIMHNDIVSASQAGKRENKKSCISILCSWFKRCFSLTRGAKAADEV
ncbi:Uncharacterized protein Rs2_47647 [Raphanus sativus]|nr:Uncharacterized protein Rs2_47647 [Raphanus sativus]